MNDNKKQTFANNTKHKYLNDIGIPSTDPCIFNTADTSDDRMDRFVAQREKYGFDDRETWNLDYTMASWIYSHLRMLLDVSIVDLEYHKFDIPALEDIPLKDREYFPGTTIPKRCTREIVKSNVTEKECIEEICKYLAFFLVDNDIDEDADMDAQIKEEIDADQKGYECLSCAFKILAIISPALWW